MIASRDKTTTRKSKTKKTRRTPIDWKSYNRELVKRGKNIANALKSLKSYNEDEELEMMNKCKNGSPFVYTDRFIILLVIIKVITGLSYRIIEGLGSLFSDKVISYSQLCRRTNKMPQAIIDNINRKVTKAITKAIDTIDVIMDGTGIMVNNTYVWVDEKTNTARRRNWKKLHFVIDRKSKAILFLEVMDKNKNEAENENMRDTMLDALENIDDDISITRAFGDGLYDSNDNFDMFDQAGIELVTRIREPTVNIAKSKTNSSIISDWELRRFKANLRNRIAIKQIDWKRYVKEHQYGLRGGVEGFIGAFKRLFREYAYSKKDENIVTEFKFKQLTWNIMRL